MQSGSPARRAYLFSCKHEELNALLGRAKGVVSQIDACMMVDV